MIIFIGILIVIINVLIVISIRETREINRIIKELETETKKLRRELR